MITHRATSSQHSQNTTTFTLTNSDIHTVILTHAETVTLIHTIIHTCCHDLTLSHTFKYLAHSYSYTFMCANTQSQKLGLLFTQIHIHTLTPITYFCTLT